MGLMGRNQWEIWNMQERDVRRDTNDMDTGWHMCLAFVFGKETFTL